MEAHHQRPGHEPLERLEDKLGDGGELRHRAVRLAEDGLREPHQHDVAVEAVQKVAHLIRLAHVVVLVHVKRLQIRAARVNHRLVLVLGLALADDGIAGKFHLVLDAARAARLVAPDEARREVLLRGVRRDVHEAHLQVGVFADQLLDGVRLVLVQRPGRRRALLPENLRRHEKLKLAPRHPLGGFVVVSLQPRQQAHRRAVQADASHAPRQRLRSVAGPGLRLRPVLEKHHLVVLAECADAFLEVVEVLGERRDDEREERLLVLQPRGELGQAVLDVLRVVRRERGPRAHLRYGRGRLE